MLPKNIYNKFKNYFFLVKLKLLSKGFFLDLYFLFELSKIDRDT